MTINYPNGPSLSNNGRNNRKKQASTPSKRSSFANRGMSFEEFINQSNAYYHQKKIAIVHKKPTPIQIVKVDYPKRSAAKISEAYFTQASTTDYNGVYRGFYLDFEAKETKNKTSFPLSNFHQHQVTHMTDCLNQDGIAFVLLWFSSLQRCFFLDALNLSHYWNKRESGTKSIPLSEIETHGIEIPVEFAPRIPYIRAIDQYIEKESQPNEW